MGVSDSKEEIVVSFERLDLAAVFEESMHIIANTPELYRLTEESAKNTEVIDDAQEVVTNNYHRKSDGNNVSVIAGTSFDTARKLMRKYGGEKKVAVLNFANAYNPGGGVIRGARAQEECLCRCSTLYISLMKVSDTPGFYAAHNIQRMRHPDELNQPGMIYTPDVAIFRADDYTVLDEPVIVDVITCAAPENWRGSCDETSMREIHEEKAKAILDLAIEHDVDLIVMGAFGCGAFSNPPEIVADVYKKVLNQKIKDRVNNTVIIADEGLEYRNCFNEVVFAIRSKNEIESTNLQVFSKILNFEG